jgi:hypothetical protein
VRMDFGNRIELRSNQLLCLNCELKWNCSLFGYNLIRGPNDGYKNASHAGYWGWFILWIYLVESVVVCGRLSGNWWCLLYILRTSISAPVPLIGLLWLWLSCEYHKLVVEAPVKMVIATQLQFL